jgi:FKBP-type peptidyl-prolyl cis-trans isomerase
VVSIATMAAADDGSILRDQKAKNSYAVGVEFGQKLKAAPLDLDAALVARGVTDALSGKNVLLTEAEIKAAQAALRNDMRMKQAETIKRLADKNKSDGEAFLAANREKDDIVTLKSGLQYKILKAGAGQKPGAGDSVVCHYRGTLIDGTEFDSSIARNRPATFPLKQVIKGWTEALQLMPVGSKWQLFIPPDLGYGERGPLARGPSKIGPNAALIFDVELIAIQEPAATAEADKGITGIQVSFKLDPRLTGGLYIGERWVVPPYTTTLDTVEARVAGTDSKGGLRKINPQWTPSDPEMVTVSPSEGSDVKISVKRAGETTLNVTSGGVTKQLTVKAAARNEGMLVEIAQR